ncbi:ribonuclease P protein component [bacterium]|nr:ribonuclease P protein component [bacterium]NBX49243.1 ribonuclease P protein component [bacterium]
MFSQQHRLRSEKEVLRAIRSKRGAFDVVCGVKLAENTVGHPRFVIVVSTKVSKRAVDRNRVRRQYREICKEFIPLLPSCDIALLVSKPALELTFQAKRERLKHVFQKAKILS